MHVLLWQKTHGGAPNSNSGMLLVPYCLGPCCKKNWASPGKSLPYTHASTIKHAKTKQPGQQATRGSRPSQLSHSFFHPHHEVGAATVTCFVPWFLDLLFDLREYARSPPSRNTAKKSHTPFGGKNRGTEPPSKDQNRISPCQTIYLRYHSWPSLP